MSAACNEGEWRDGWDSLISRDTQALNRGNLVEEVGDIVLVGVERKVADEESVALGADDIAVLAGALGSASGRGRVVVGLAGKVEAHVAALEEGAVLVVEGLLGVLGGVEVDVTEAAGAARILVSDNASALDALAVLELLVQSIVVDAPAEVADPEGSALLGSLATLRLVLLGRGEGSLGLLLGLPLLGRLLGGGRLLLGGPLLRLLLRLGLIRVRLLVRVGLVGARLARLVLRLPIVSA